MVTKKTSFANKKVVALAGGVGGARLADGLAQALPSENLTIIVNTGDDFEHYGLYICPDVDTVCYTLAGLANPATGWGRHKESWNALKTLEQLGGETWFGLGDHDLAVHLERTRRKRSGEPLSRITSDFCRAWGIGPRVIPMTDDFVSTWVYTEDGPLPFQEYFVHRRCMPSVLGFDFRGIDNASPAPGVLQALEQADLVIICPSNPWVSIDPILELPGMRTALAKSLIIAVSPIIGGKTVKGPAAKMFLEMGIEPSALSVAQHYGKLLDGFVLDNLDKDLAQAIDNLGIKAYVTDAIMKSRSDRRRLAQETLIFSSQFLK